MKKLIELILIYIVSLAITLFLFYVMSWYSFGTFPTRIVLIRIIFVSVMLALMIKCLVIFKRTKKHYYK